MEQPSKQPPDDFPLSPKRWRYNKNQLKTGGFIMMFTKKEMILLAVFGSEDAGQTRRNLTKAARLAEDASTRKSLSALSRHISREIGLGHDYELEFDRIQDEVQPRLLASLTVFNDRMDDYTHVYPVRQLAKCLLMKAFSCDTVADSIDNLEQLKAYIPDKWFAAVLNDLLEDLYNVWANEYWMYPEIRDSSIAIANAAEWFCTATDMEKKALHSSGKKKRTASV
jgi:hypothetical protein